MHYLHRYYNHTAAGNTNLDTNPSRPLYANVFCFILNSIHASLDVLNLEFCKVYIHFHPLAAGYVYPKTPNKPGNLYLKPALNFLQFVYRSIKDRQTK